jgi:hypothetical protein
MALVCGKAMELLDEALKHASLESGAFSDVLKQYPVTPMLSAALAVSVI